jgi:hypothetical protein
VAARVVMDIRLIVGAESPDDPRMGIDRRRPSRPDDLETPSIATWRTKGRS